MSATSQLTDALSALRDGSGSFDQVRVVAEQTQFTPRPRWDMDSPNRDYASVEGSFEDTVTPWLQRRVISREQWRELRDIWKAQSASPTPSE